MDKLKSRKLWAMIVCAVLNVLNAEVFGIPGDALGGINLLVMFYIGAEATVDVGKEIANIILAFLSPKA
jgi:hypothetical protein